jgi:hypothetical protein
MAAPHNTRQASSAPADALLLLLLLYLLHLA